ncbi:MAG TPA: ribosomal protein L7/L12 [Pirellulales bacterium]|nr:ribosomal protein L7/L12 [Pirellulales bacterium]
MPACPICGRQYDSDLAYCPDCRGEKQADAAPAPQPADWSAAGGEIEELRRDVQAVLQSAGKIAAIKLYRERTATGLAEAKSAVEAIERQSLAPPAMKGDLEQQLLALLQGGKKIEAIRLYREQTGVGLKEAKDAVESLAGKHGIAAKGAGCAGMLLAAVTLAAAIASLG